MFGKRIILISLFIFSLCGLCACSDRGNIYSSISSNDLVSTISKSPNKENWDLENTINEAMMALQNLDMEIFNEYTNNKQIMTTPWGDENIEYTLFGELCEEYHTDSNGDLVYQLDKEIVKNLSWQISDIIQDDNVAKIKIQITNLNMEGVFQKAETNSEMISEIKKIPLNDTKTIELNIDAEKKEGVWILLIDFDFANAISANIWFSNTEDYLKETSYDSTDNNYFSSEFFTKSIMNEPMEKSYTYEGVAKTSKNQKIEIISASDDKITAQITDLYDITNFLNQEETQNWIIVESIPYNVQPILSIVRYSLERKTLNPQLKEQSRDVLYQAEDIYYIEDKTIYNYTDISDDELPHYYKIPSNVGEYLKQFL